MKSSKGSSSQRPTHAYIGVQRYCKCVTSSVLDMFTTAADRATTARLVADMVREGLIVKHVPLAKVEMDDCTHQIKPSGQGTLAI